MKTALRLLGLLGLLLLLSGGQRHEELSEFIIDVGDDAFLVGDEDDIVGPIGAAATCRKGCPCGQSCIDCSKTCHKGSSGGGCG